MEEKFEQQKEIPELDMLIDEEGNNGEEPELPVLNDCEALEERVSVDYVGRKLLYLPDVGGPIVISDLIEVSAVTKNLSSQEVYVSLIHRTAYSVNEDLQCDFKTLGTPNLLSKFLLEKGVIIYGAAVGLLSKYLMHKADKLSQPGTIKYCHDSLGWKIKNGNRIGFLSDNSIGMPYPSKLRGNEDKLIGSNGNRSVYEDMILREVIPVKSLHLPLVLAFTAPIVPIISAKADVEALLVNFAGKSSQGKSTSLKLIASVWGKGVISNDSLAVAKTFSSTFNSFEASMNDNNGFPAIFDDYESADSDFPFGKLIYRLSTGSSKRRCDSKGGVLSTSNWRTFIGFSGESSILERADTRQGLRGRIVEFNGVVWTSSAQNSNAITKTVVEHYGFYGEEFVRKLMLISKQDLERRFEKAVSELEESLPPIPGDGVSARQINRLAIIKMTAVLARELMDLEIDVDYVTNQIIENEKNRRDALSVFDRAKEDLAEFICSNYGNFIKNIETLQEVKIPSGKIYGRIYDGQKGQLVNILPSEMDKVMSKYRTQKDEIFSKWRDEKFLICDKDGRFTKKIRITRTMNVRTYTIISKDLKGLAKRIEEDDETSIEALEQEELEERKNQTQSSGVVIQTKGETHEYPQEEKMIAKRKEDAKKKAQEPPVLETNYDDDESFNAIFDESTDEKSKGDN